MIRRWWKEF